VGAGKKCVGDKVIRCTWVNYDSVNRRFRAYASVKDTPDTSPYSVKVNDIQLVYKDPVRGYVGVGAAGADNDGWHDETDTGSGGLVGCDVVRTLPGQTVYARAAFAWQGASTSSGTLVSLPVMRC
jgi:hypothetical protein